jgi:TPR repeat protein
MPIDYIIILIPLIIIASAITAILVPATRDIALGVTIGSAVLFLFIYAVPGVYWMILARFGNVNAQYRLGIWHWKRFGYMYSNTEARDKWFRKAAESDHPEAMAQVGWFYIWTREGDPQSNYKAARYWLEKAARAGNRDAINSLEILRKREVAEGHTTE